MAWLNVSVAGLSGRHHPVLNGAVTARDVTKLRPMVRMLSGDYFCYAVKSDQAGGGDHCRLCLHLCPAAPRRREDLLHILTECEGSQETRDRVMHHLELLLDGMNKNPSHFHEIVRDKPVLCQFILDCSSLNLPNHLRININDARITEVVKTNRDICYAVHSERIRKMKLI